MEESRATEEGLPAGATAAMSAIYEEAIEATIQACSSIQNPKVLLAIEKQWRQALRRRRLEVKRALALRERENQGALNSQSADSATQSGDSKASVSVDTSSKADAGNEEGCVEKKGEDSSDVGACDSAKAINAGASNEQTEDSEDDFADAEVDEAETGSAAATLSSINASSASTQNAKALPSSNAAPSSEVRISSSNGDKGAASEDEGSGAEDMEEGASLTAMDVSDLDDAEPKTLDALFAFYDKVERSGAGSRRTGKWRALLRHGILRIGGNEMPFDALYGDFTF